MTDSLETAVSETKAVTQSEEFEALEGLKRQFHCGTSSEHIVHTCTGFTGRVSKYMLFGTDDRKNQTVNGGKSC